MSSKIGNMICIIDEIGMDYSRDLHLLQKLYPGFCSSQAKMMPAQKTFIRPRKGELAIHN